MIPLILFCVVGGCLDQPIDNRPIHRQIMQDQLSKPAVSSCYYGDKYYKDCRDADPFGFGDDDEEELGMRDPRNRD